MQWIRKFFFVLVILLGNNSVFANTADIIYIYNDTGSSQESVKQTLNTFKNLAPNYTVQLIDATEVLKGQWTQHAVLFVMPGGAATPYAKKLNGQGNQIIKDYVKNGGTYLGMCAGGYYGAQSIEFDKHGPLEILTTAELAFFPGKAIGPVLADYNYQNNSGARAAAIQLNLPDDHQLVHFYFNGGAYFENAAAYPNVKVLGFYQIKHKPLLPAIIKIPYGNGIVILSGVHFEYSVKLLDHTDSYLIPLLPVLQKSEIDRVHFLRLLFKNIFK